MEEGALGFEDLPAEVQCGVLGHLSARELGGVVPLVSQSWRQVGLTDSLWLAQLRHRFPNTPYPPNGSRFYLTPPPCLIYLHLTNLTIREIYIL